MEQNHGAEFMDCEEFAESQDVYGAPLQHGQVDNDIHTTSKGISNEPALCVDGVLWLVLGYVRALADLCLLCFRETEGGLCDD